MRSNYSPTIIEHYRRPRNYGDLEDADITSEIDNPICGDRVRLALRLDGGTIAAARFKGDCCAICKAAASILTTRVEGRTLAEVEALSDADHLAALDAEISTARLACALLPLRALREGVRSRPRGAPR